MLHNGRLWPYLQTLYQACNGQIHELIRTVLNYGHRKVLKHRHLVPRLWSDSAEKGRAGASGGGRSSLKELKSFCYAGFRERMRPHFQLFEDVALSNYFGQIVEF